MVWVESPKAEGRAFAPVRWDTVFSIGGVLEDSLLLRPRLLAARGGSLYVYDYYDFRLKAFDAAGNVRWLTGRRGTGPGEFANPFDVAVAPDGTVWVVDAGAGRLAAYSPAGELRGYVNLGGRRIRDLLPLRDEQLATSVSADDRFWIALDAEGDVAAEGRLPLAELRDAAYIVRTTYAATATDGRTWAAVFPLGEPLLVYEGRTPRCRGRLVEAGPFPEELLPGRTVWAAAVAVSDSSVFVLVPGLTDDALRILDEYSAVDCSYRRTLLLPRKFVAMAYDDGVFYFGYEKPAPGIMALRAGVE